MNLIARGRSGARACETTGASSEQADEERDDPQCTGDRRHRRRTVVAQFDRRLERGLRAAEPEELEHTDQDQRDAVAERALARDPTQVLERDDLGA